MRCVAVDYPALTAAPAVWAGRVGEFPGADRLPHPEAMADCVRPELYRNRGAAGTAAGVD